jgi:hypothetical protein
MNEQISWPPSPWPDGCHDPDSCHRHSACMYIQCRYHGARAGNEAWNNAISAACDVIRKATREFKRRTVREALEEVYNDVRGLKR